MSDWGTIATFMAGAATPVAVKFAESIFGRKVRKDDRREDFQHRTLIELQEAVHENARIMGRLYFLDAKGFKETGAWGRVILPHDLDEQEGETRRRINMLCVRVQDEQLRKVIGEYVTNSAKHIKATNAEDAVTSIEATMKSHENVNARVGELLRSL